MARLSSSPLPRLGAARLRAAQLGAARLRAAQLGVALFAAALLGPGARAQAPGGDAEPLVLARAPTAQEMLGVDPASLPAAMRRLAPGAPAAAPRRAPAPRPPSQGRRIMINIPSRRLRVYQGSEKIFDVPMAIGRRVYPGVRGNTRTRIGSYRITSWHKDYRSHSYPTSWGTDSWRGAFGKYTAKLGPRASYQYIHGTVGPEWLGDWLVDKLDPVPADQPEGEVTADAMEGGLSHGCTRLSNTNIQALHEKCPLGTPVEKFYCLVEVVEGPDGQPEEVTYPNLYRYQLATPEARFDVRRGVLTGYRHPPYAVGPR